MPLPFPVNDEFRIVGQELVPAYCLTDAQKILLLVSLAQNDTAVEDIWKQWAKPTP